MTLKEFYQAYKKYLIDQKDNFYDFNNTMGLCAALYSFCEIESGDKVTDLYIKLAEEMKQQFRDKGLSTIYPFDLVSQNFSQDREVGRMHLNPRRIMWVAKHA